MTSARRLSTYIAFVAITAFCVAHPALAQEPPLPSAGVSASLKTNSESSFEVDASTGFSVDHRVVTSFGMGSSEPRKFSLEIDGVSAGGIRNVQGLSSEIEVVEYRSGDDPITRKRPGRTKYANITLKRGFVQRDPLTDWKLEISSGTEKTRSGSLVIFDDRGGALSRYDFFECFPTRWLTQSDLLLRKEGSPQEEQIDLTCKTWKEFSPAEEQLKAAPRH